jgi:hypothetical protein
MASAAASGWGGVAFSAAGAGAAALGSEDRGWEADEGGAGTHAFAAEHGTATLPAATAAMAPPSDASLLPPPILRMRDLQAARARA